MSKSLAVGLLVLVLASTANATIITTTSYWGGEVTSSPDGTNNMLMLGISFSTSTGLSVATTASVPTLRALPAGDTFDPSAVWYSKLNGNAYNYQYGWSKTSSLSNIPTGDGVWIERLSQTPGLETYYRGSNFGYTNYQQIFASDGAIWKFGDLNKWPSMQHNAYAVTNPTLSTYTATYKVYVGDATNGAEVTNAAGSPAYASTNVTWTWNATPTPEPSTLVMVGIALASIAAFSRLRRSSKSV